MAVRFMIPLLFVLMLVPVAAANAVDYTVRDLAVDVQGDNAIDARDKALVQARGNAYNILMKRMFGRENDFPTPDASTIASMVDSFEINREKLSKNRYLASVNVSFNERSVQSYIVRSANPEGMPYRVGDEPYVGGGYYYDDDAMRTGNAGYNRSYTQSDYGMGDNQDGMMSPLRTPLTQSTVRIDLSGIRQWINVRKTLESVDFIKNVEIEQITSRQVIVNLQYRGTVNDLQGQLVGRGMKLYSNTDATRTTIPYVLVVRG